MDSLCGKCGQKPHFVSWDDHISHGECDLNIFIRECVIAQYVPIYIYGMIAHADGLKDADHTISSATDMLDAIRELNISHKSFEHQTTNHYVLHIWGPKWLKTALETFKKMPTFADLSLKEYLSKMM